MAKQFYVVRGLACVAKCVVFLTIGLVACAENALCDAFVYSGGVFTTIDVPNSTPQTSKAEGINNAGQIVGRFTDASGTEQGFVDNNGVITTFTDPSANFRNTAAMGINSANQIVGYSLTGHFPLAPTSKASSTPTDPSRP